jgi:hypothetical protein
MARVSIGVGIVLILVSVFAALRPSSIFYAELHTGVEATFDCGNAILRIEVTGELADQVGAKDLCEEQHTIYTVLSLIALALGAGAVVDGARRRGDNTPAELSEAPTA